MINLKDTNAVQIWCDYQEETRQTSADFFLRLRFSNFRTFINNVTNYDDDSNGYGYGTQSGDGWGDGDNYSFGFGGGDGWGYGDE